VIELHEAWNKPEKAEEWRAKLPQREGRKRRGATEDTDRSAVFRGASQLQTASSSKSSSIRCSR